MEDIEQYVILKQIQELDWVIAELMTRREDLELKLPNVEEN